IAAAPDSHTGRYLATVLDAGRPVPAAAAEVHETPAPATPNGCIRVVGAREHNLKDVSLEPPRDRLIVMTGLSGSGKSSLAFDVLYAEGQRRYIDSLSAYARQFLHVMAKPEVDLLLGLPPTVAIEQRLSRGGRNSTVATVTEVAHYLRLLFAKLGVQHCPSCDAPIRPQTRRQILDHVRAEFGTTRITLLAPVVRGPLERPELRAEKRRLLRMLAAAGVPLDRPVVRLAARHRRAILEGNDGALAVLRARLADGDDDLGAFTVEAPCDACAGERLN